MADRGCELVTSGPQDSQDADPFSSSDFVVVDRSHRAWFVCKRGRGVLTRENGYQ